MNEENARWQYGANPSKVAESQSGRDRGHEFWPRKTMDTRYKDSEGLVNRSQWKKSNRALIYGRWRPSNDWLILIAAVPVRKYQWLSIDWMDECVREDEGELFLLFSSDCYWEDGGVVLPTSMKGVFTVQVCFPLSCFEFIRIRKESYQTVL